MNALLKSPLFKALIAIPLAIGAYVLLASGMLHLPGVSGQYAKPLLHLHQFSLSIPHVVTLYCFALLLLFVRIREPVFSYFGWQTPQWQSSTFVWMLAFAILGAVAVAVGHPHTLPVMQAWEKAWVSPLSSAGWHILMLIVVLPLVEELIFRGLLYGLIAKSALGESLAIVISSYLWLVPFTHAQGAVLLLNGLLGLGLAWTRQQTNSVQLPMLMRLVYGAGLLLGFVIS